MISKRDAKTLETLVELNPALYEFMCSREYQLKDVVSMLRMQHPINMNEPGTGKTVETIGTIYGAGLDAGPVLIIAPYTALEATWGDSIARWLPGMPTATSAATGVLRGRQIAQALTLALAGQPVWLVMNPESFKMNKQKKSAFPDIFKVKWNCVVIDEFHRMGMNNNKTLFFKSIKKLQAEKKILLSGTPMGGKPIKLWPALHLVDPESFPGKWRFAEEWLSVRNNGFGQEFGDVLKPLRPMFEEQIMYPYTIRRLKKDIMEWLPPKNQIVQWVRLTGKQLAQYKEWEANTEIEIDDKYLSALSILAVYTRLRQFANATQTIVTLDDGSLKLTPTADSAKLPHLEELLDELGILEGTGSGQVVVFSQFTQFVNVISEWLHTKRVAHGVITGETKGPARAPLVRGFQAGEFRVMLMNTQAGGVSITLDAADTVVFMDETWNPDDQTQAEDRTHRGSKNRQVNIYRFLAKDTIEEQIFKGNITRDRINDRVLNRKGLVT